MGTERKPSETPDAITEAVAEIRRRWSRQPRLAIVLGTGLGELAKEIDTDAVLSYTEIPHFPPATVLSHAGCFVCGRLHGVPVVAMSGRFHFYEGYSCEQVTLPVRVMHRLGADSLILSNASGAVNPRMAAGDLMAIADHIDCMGRRTAFASDRVLVVPSRRGDLLYDPSLIEHAQRVARDLNIVLHRGVYVAVNGPNYETRAEYRAFRRIGGDVVGMSTIPEALVAGACGMRILAISTITNVAAPDALTATTAEGVVEIAGAAAPRLRALMSRLIVEGVF